MPENQNKNKSQSQKVKIASFTFLIDEEGYVKTSDGEALGHVEDCAQIAKALQALFDLF